MSSARRAPASRESTGSTRRGALCEVPTLTVEPLLPTSSNRRSDELPAGTAPLIALARVGKTFPPQHGNDALEALRDVSFALAEGEIVAVVGPSGCGKSTLLNMIVGLEEPTSGTITNRVRPASGAHGWAGYMTQADSLLPWRTVRENAELGLELRGCSRRERRERANELLARVGLAGFERRYPRELSGGMRKRVALVRVLAYRPRVLLLDEPFGALDVLTRQLLHDDLMALWGESRPTIALVTHDLVEAIALADRVLVLSYRPGTIKSVHSIGLPRPRPLLEVQVMPGFTELYRQIWGELRHEVGRAREAGATGG